MPLIALDILENKIKELIIVINHLKEENDSLNARLSSGSGPSRQQGAVSGADASPGLLYELENMKKTLIKYKNDRNQLYTKLAGALRQVDELINKE